MVLNSGNICRGIFGSYGWGDLLTSYDGQEIKYDEVGNPEKIGDWSFTWEHGRELRSMTDGTTRWGFLYDADGMRIIRNNGTIAYWYLYNGDMLRQMTVGDVSMSFVYNADGPMIVGYSGTTYYYVRNLQGDIIAILDPDGNAVVEYTYDAWGKILSVTGSMADTLGFYNPFRYRGYVYDAESGLYYLQSRYYSPEIGRFINADALVSTGQGSLSKNMFCYCENNPVMGYDPSGMINWGGVLAGIVIGAIAVAAIAVTVATAGAASPLVAAVGTSVGTTVSAALVEASVVTTAGAIAEVPVVYDVTVVGGDDRAGASLVYDFGENTSDFYLHTGKQSKEDLSLTFGSGFVFNYDEPGDYAGEFLDVSASVDNKGASFGLDYCTSPNNLTNGYRESHALLLTSGYSCSLTNSKLPTFSYDYYWPIS